MRYILDDGITTLSYGHKDMKLVVEVDEVRDQQRATVIAAVELRKKGRRWQKRKGVEKRLGFDPEQQDSEGE